MMHAARESGALAGRGHVTIAARGDRAYVARARAESPLKLLFPRNHGSAQWVFTATYGGGLVDGDGIVLDLEIDARASAFVSTQSATKVYRSPRGTSQSLDARVATGALLALVPDPVSCFAGARYSQRAHVALAGGASLLLVDAFTCGRAARGERWDFAHLASRTTITRDGHAVLTDATVLSPRKADFVRGWERSRPSRPP